MQHNKCTRHFVQCLDKQRLFPVEFPVYDQTNAHYIEVLLDACVPVNCSCTCVTDPHPQPVVWICNLGCQGTAEFSIYPGCSSVCLMVTFMMVWFQWSSVFPPVKVRGEWHASAHTVRTNWWWQENDNLMVWMDFWLCFPLVSIFFFPSFLDQWMSHL